MSGSAVTGNRTNDTMPMNSSTTNSTIGGSGWRIAHAEMFLTSASPERASAGRVRGRGDLHRLAIVQEAARRDYHALAAAEARGDDDAGIGGVGDPHRAPLGVLLSVDDEDIGALGIG